MHSNLICFPSPPPLEFHTYVSQRWKGRPIKVLGTEHEAGYDISARHIDILLACMHVQKSTYYNQFHRKFLSLKLMIINENLTS